MQRATRKVSLRLSSQAERYARRDAPRDVRLMASRGALPLPPVELATVLFALMHDPDAEVKATARTSLENLPESVCDSVLSGDAHPALLSHLAHAFRDDERRLEKLALNPACDDATIAFLAGLPFRRLVDIVSNNQERMLRASEIVDALGANPLTGRSVIDRILGFLGYEQPDESGARPAGQPLDEAEAEAALRAILGDDLGRAAPSLVRERGSDESDPEAPESANLYALIQKMTVTQKVKLARLGNSEARGLLVRDRNKVVAVAAIHSPKVSENEVIGFAQSRSLSDEVLRLIANNRHWTRSYKVKLALATNPKTPQQVAIRFVGFLHENDLRAIMKSKDVPAAIATHARRLLSRKGKL